MHDINTFTPRIDRLELSGRTVLGERVCQKEFSGIVGRIRQAPEYSRFRIISEGSVSFQYVDKGFMKLWITLNLRPGGLLSCGVKIKVNLNTLLAFQLSSEKTDGLERNSLPRNALPTSVIQQVNPSILLKKQIAILESVLNRVNSLACSLHQCSTSFANNTEFRQFEFSIYTIELCYDLVVQDTRAAVQKLSRILSSIGVSFESSEYKDQKVSSSGFDKNKLCFTSILSALETLKAYEKTSNQVRLEATLGGKAVRALSCPNRFTCISDPNFVTMQQSLISYFQNRLEGVFSEYFQNDFQSLDLPLQDILRAVYLIAKLARNQFHMGVVLNSLIARDSVYSDSEVGYLVRALCKAGVLVKVRKGLYRPLVVNFDQLKGLENMLCGSMPSTRNHKSTTHYSNSKESLE